MFIQKICYKERVLELINSIKNLWVEPYEDIEGDEYGISFGSDNGYVIYNYVSNRKEIKDIYEMVIS